MKPGLFYGTAVVRPGILQAKARQDVLAGFSFVQIGPEQRGVQAFRGIRGRHRL